MTAYRLSGGSANDGMQNLNGSGFTNNYDRTQISSGASTAAAGAGVLRFGPNPLPVGATIRRATLRVRFNYESTGARFDVYGHKVSNPGDLNAQNVVARFGAQTTATRYVEFLSAPPTNVPYDIDVTDIVSELVGQVGWASGNALAFILKGRVGGTAFMTRLWSNDYAADSGLWTELYVEHGALDSDYFDFDLVTLGDSHAVCAGHAGFPVNNVSVTAFGWTNQVIAQTYAGMVQTSASFGADLFGAGDQRRGYTPQGIVQDKLSSVIGDGAAIIYRGEFAKGGTTLSGWQGDISAGAGGLWGTTSTVGTLKHRLANPFSQSRRMLVWVSLTGNDLLQVGQGGGAIIEPRDATFWDAYRADWTTKLSAVVNEVLTIAAANNVDARVCLVGYHNFIVHNKNPTNWAYVPDSSDQPLERMVWGTTGFAFYGQASFDTVDNNVRSTTNLSKNSTFVRFAAQRMIDVNGAFNPSDAFNWASAQLWAATTAVASPRTWLRAFGAASTGWPGGVVQDGWRDGWRNITDITVNRMMVGETTAVINAAIAANPSWGNKVIAPLKPQANGVDTGRSANPASVYAQPNPDTYGGQTDGIHGTKAFFENWVSAVVSDINMRVDWLPGYVAGSLTHEVTLTRWDSAGTRTTNPRGYIVGDKWEARFKLSAGDTPVNQIQARISALSLGLSGNVGWVIRQVSGPWTTGGSIATGTVITSGSELNIGPLFNIAANTSDEIVIGGDVVHDG